jgi:hypothetical protein
MNHDLVDERTNTFCVLSALLIALPEGPWLTEDVETEEHRGMVASLFPLMDDGDQSCCVSIWVVDVSKDITELDVLNTTEHGVAAWDTNHRRLTSENCEADGQEVLTWTPSRLVQFNGMRSVRTMHLRAGGNAPEIYLENRFCCGNIRWVVMGRVDTTSPRWSAVLNAVFESVRPR